MRLTRFFFMVLLTSLIASCSLIKTSYNNAPALTIFWLDDYFSFSQAQNLTLKPSLQKLHQWHRQTQLSQYINLLQAMQTGLAQEQINANDVCDTFTNIKLNIHALQLESIPIIVEMAPLLSDKQLKRFQLKLVKRSDKWKDDYWQESKQKQVAERLEKAEDFAEKIYGNLNDAQLILLKQRITEANINPAISYKEIQRRNEDAFTILSSLQNSTLTPDEQYQLVKAGFERLQKSPEPIYQNYTDELTKLTCEAVANLHATTDEKQKLHAKNWLQDYIVQMTALQIK